MSPTPYTGPERRRYKRTDRPVAASIQFPAPNAILDWNAIKVRNVSAGGIYFDFSEKIYPGSILNFRLRLLPESKTFRCAGVVLRCSKSGTEDLYGVAVSFVDIEPEDMAAINLFASD